MSDRFARIETLYHAARALPKEECHKYLAQAADDDEMRREAVIPSLSLAISSITPLRPTLQRS